MHHLMHHLMHQHTCLASCPDDNILFHIVIWWLKLILDLISFIQNMCLTGSAGPARHVPEQSSVSNQFKRNLTMLYGQREDLLMRPSKKQECRPIKCYNTRASVARRSLESDSFPTLNGKHVLSSCMMTRLLWASQFVQVTSTGQYGQPFVYCALYGCFLLARHNAALHRLRVC